MTLDDFIVKWQGRYIDFDGAYGPQCMDLMHQYCVEVLGIANGAVLAAPDARTVYNNFSNVTGHELFDQIPNTPTGVPQEGDIVFWGFDPNGHVAIFHDGDINSFKSFDQNYPTGSNCHIQTHSSYANVLGWLRFKSASTLPVDKATFENLVRKATIYDTIRGKLNVADSDTMVYAEIDKLISEEDMLPAKDKQISDAQGQIAFLQSQLTELQTDKATLQKEHDDLSSQVATQAKTIQDQDTQIKALDGKSQALQENIDTLIKQIKQPVRKGWKAALVALIDKL